MKIGILGGGQLGMMMAEAAHALGHTVIGLDPNPTCSLSMIANDMIIADYDDVDAVGKLFDESDVITYEFENVDAEMIRKKVDVVPQQDKALVVSKHRLLEKDFVSSLGVKTPQYHSVQSIKDVFVPSIVKTVTGGYDGKGQYVITSKSTIDQLSINQAKMYICEEYIDFDYEISVIATRSKNNEIAFFPIPRNEHKNGILFLSDLTRKLPLNIIKQAQEYTEIILESLDYVGTLAVEFFVRDNDVIFNEFAPRPHNSGHYTIEGCNVSQFENHIRAITGSRLIEPVLKIPTIMLNIIGKKPLNKGDKHNSTVYTHDYYKKQNREGRKMGHVTITDSNIERLHTTLQQLIEAYYE